MADPGNAPHGPSFVPLIVVAVLVVVAIAVFLLTRASPAAPAVTTATGDGKKALTIAVIPKGTTHEFWKSVHAGARKAEQELTAGGQKLTVIWKGPLKEDDRAGQIDVVENFTQQGVSGILLAPLDHQALVKPVEDAIARTIPVVIFDSGLKSDRQASFVATNNFKGGQLGGQRLGEVLGGMGKVILLRYQEGSASTEEREKGFLDAIGKFPGISLISTDQHAGATSAAALTVSQNLLNRFKDEVTGIFTPNESSTAGMIIALRDAGLTAKVKHVGFDASAPLIAALKTGAVSGLVVQDPFDMGYRGVLTLVKAIKGQAVDKQVDTNVALVTPENIGTPAMMELLNPPLDKYLK